jgi:hypothetical protein
MKHDNRWKKNGIAKYIGDNYIFKSLFFFGIIEQNSFFESV